MLSEQFDSISSLIKLPKISMGSDSVIFSNATVTSKELLQVVNFDLIAA